MLTAVSKSFIVNNGLYDVKAKLLDSYCLDVYGSQLW